MKVAMIGPFGWSPKGTVSHRAFFIARTLAARGHEVTLLIPPYDNPSHAGFQWEWEGVRVINLALPTWGDSVRARLKVPLAMARLAARLEPDVVHVFKPTGYAGLTATYVRRLHPRLPLVLDCDDWEGRGGWADINSHPRLWRWFLYWQEGWLSRRADAVTVASRTLEKRVACLGLCKERVFYLPNGPDPALLTQRAVSVIAQKRLRRTLGISDRPMAVYVGHIAYGSEVSVAIEAVPVVTECHPRFRVVIAGGGPGLSDLQERAQSMAVSEQIVFAGAIKPAQLPVLLASADLALYPHRDSLVNRAKSPSKITAYMALGKPIVASAVGEAVEYLDNGRAGLLVAPDDAVAFGQGMVTLLKDPERAAELGRRAERRIWQCYDWTRQVTKVERAYQVARESHAM